MWGSDALWSWLNQVGILCTIAGFALTLLTFAYVRKVRKLLIIKGRVPEVSADISKLLPLLRQGLRRWEESEEDILHRLYEVKGLIENIKPSLGEKEKVLAVKISAMINFEPARFKKWQPASGEYCWLIYRHLVQFNVMLSGLHKDNEVSRV